MPGRTEPSTNFATEDRGGPPVRQNPSRLWTHAVLEVAWLPNAT